MFSASGGGQLPYYYNYEYSKALRSYTNTSTAHTDASHALLFYCYSASSTSRDPPLACTALLDPTASSTSRDPPGASSSRLDRGARTPLSLVPLAAFLISGAFGRAHLGSRLGHLPVALAPHGRACRSHPSREPRDRADRLKRPILGIRHPISPHRALNLVEYLRPSRLKEGAQHWLLVGWERVC